MEFKLRQPFPKPEDRPTDTLSVISSVVESRIQHLDQKAQDLLDHYSKAPDKPESINSCIAKASCPLYAACSRAENECKSGEAGGPGSLTQGEVHICNHERLRCSAEEIQGSIQRLQILRIGMRSYNLSTVLWLLDENRYEGFSQDKLERLFLLK